MIKFKTLKQNLKNFERVIIRELPNGVEMIATKAVFDKQRKEFRFLNEHGDVILKFRQYDALITRIATSDFNEDFNTFEFSVCLKDGADYRMNFIMRENRSFFIKDEYERKNVEAVLEATPKHLKNLDRKKIKVKRFSLNEIFTTLGDDDNEKNIMTDCYTVNDLRFSVFTLSGVVVIDISDDNFNGGLSRILNVQFIVDNAGEENSVIIGTPDSEYVLTVVDWGDILWKVL